MNVTLTLLVRDEIDIIKSMLDYHLSQGVDRIVVTDNGSVDGTLDILRDYEKTGAVHLLCEPPSDFSQHRWVTRMARLASTAFAADWVINADADEFFVFRKGTLRQALERVARDVDVLFVDRHDFVAVESAQDDPPPATMVYRKAESTSLNGKPLAPKVIHRGDPDVTVSQGNHWVRSPRFSDEAAYGAVELFHYPLRSLRQFESKVRNAGSGYAQNTELKARVGYHKRYWYDLLLNGGLERAFHDRWFLNDAALREGLERGTIVEDRVVAERLAELRQQDVT